MITAVVLVGGGGGDGGGGWVGTGSVHQSDLTRLAEGMNIRFPSARIPARSLHMRPRTKPLQACVCVCVCSCVNEKVTMCECGCLCVR